MSVSALLVNFYALLVIGNRITIPLHETACPLDRRRSAHLLPLRNHYGGLCFHSYIAIGTPPQHFKVLIDTGSPNLWVADAESRGPLNVLENKFKTYNSTTHMMTDERGTHYFQNLCIFGQIAMDYIHIGASSVFGTFFLALETDSDIGPHVWVDGFFGLGFHPTSARYNYTLLDQLFSQGLIHQKIFTIVYGNTGMVDGFVTLGEVPLEYHGRHAVCVSLIHLPANSYLWSIIIDDIKVNRNDIVDEVTYNLTACVDTGTPMIYLPGQVLQSIHSRINASQDESGSYVVSCDEVPCLPSIGFTFASSTLYLTTGNYLLNIRAATGEMICQSVFQTTPDGFPTDVILGVVFLRNLVTVFDADARQIAFVI